ncbi:MAG: hypothetical protein KAT32_04850 [Candidatus Moranbacteria bacterium]|nr:hypothetical protein [Candidatus Moranbacteria bacterium]
MLEENNNSTVLHLRSLIYSLIFLIGIELIAMMPFQIFDWDGIFIFDNGMKINFFIYFISFILFVLSIYAGWQIGKKVIYSFVTWGLATFSVILLLRFIDNQVQKYIFAGLISLAFYATLLGAERLRKNTSDLTARSIFSSAFIAMLFLFYAGMYGFYINFEVPLWLLMLVHLVFSGFATFSSLLVHSNDKVRVALYSVIISFATMQFVWMANFWPFGYLTMATASLMFYYILWDLVHMLFLQELSKKRVLMNIGLSVILLLMVLISSRWVLV